MDVYGLTKSINKEQYYLLANKVRTQTRSACMHIGITQHGYNTFLTTMPTSVALNRLVPTGMSL